MKKLRFKAYYRDAIVSGRKYSTIRLNTDVAEGERVEVWAGWRAVGTATVTSVVRKTLSELSDEDAVLDGFRCKRELLASLRKHYGPLAPSTQVSIVRFTLD